MKIELCVYNRFSKRIVSALAENSKVVIIEEDMFHNALNWFGKIGRNLKLFQSLASMIELVSTIMIVSRDLKEFINYDFDEISKSLTHLSKLARTKEFSDLVAHVCQSMTVDILRDYKVENSTKKIQGLSSSTSLDRMSDKVMSSAPTRKLIVFGILNDYSGYSYNTRLKHCFVHWLKHRDPNALNYSSPVLLINSSITNEELDASALTISSKKKPLKNKSVGSVFSSFELLGKVEESINKDDSSKKEYENVEIIFTGEFVFKIENKIWKLIDTGMNVVLNMTHGDYATHQKRILNGHSVNIYKGLMHYLQSYVVMELKKVAEVMKTIDRALFLVEGKLLS